MPFFIKKKPSLMIFNLKMPKRQTLLILNSVATIRTVIIDTKEVYQLNSQIDIKSSLAILLANASLDQKSGSRSKMSLQIDKGLHFCNFQLIQSSLIGFRYKLRVIEGDGSHLDFDIFNKLRPFSNIGQIQKEARHTQQHLQRILPTVGLSLYLQIKSAVRKGMPKDILLKQKSYLHELLIYHHILITCLLIYLGTLNNVKTISQNYFERKFGDKSNNFRRKAQARKERTVKLTQICDFWKVFNRSVS